MGTHGPKVTVAPTSLLSALLQPKKTNSLPRRPVVWDGHMFTTLRHFCDMCHDRTIPNTDVSDERPNRTINCAAAIFPVRLNTRHWPQRHIRQWRHVTKLEFLWSENSEKKKALRSQTKNFKINQRMQALKMICFDCVKKNLCNFGLFFFFLNIWLEQTTTSRICNQLLVQREILKKEFCKCKLCKNYLKAKQKTTDLSFHLCEVINLIYVDWFLNLI